MSRVLPFPRLFLNITKTIMKRHLALAAVTALASAFAATAGDVVGTITLKGTPPKEKDITPLKEDPNCGKLHTAMPTTKFYVVGAKGELADVVVSLEGISGKSPGCQSAGVSTLSTSASCTASRVTASIRTSRCSWTSKWTKGCGAAGRATATRAPPRPASTTRPPLFTAACGQRIFRWLRANRLASG